MKIIQSTNIKDYKLILEGLVKDFDYIYYDAILKWCEIIDGKSAKEFWEVFIIRENRQNIGICGLYNINNKKSTDELWLGWFGVIPEYRNVGVGQFALDWMIKYAKNVKCKSIKSYVALEGKPLPFYYRNNFKRIDSVKSYLKSHPELTIESFEDPKDHIIELVL